METSRLEIGRATSRYLVPARHPAPLRVRDRLDTIIERELPRTLARAFDSWFSDSDPSIWIIQQLNIEAAVNVAGEPEQITRTLATQIARNLEATFHNENRDNVRYFRNRAEYLASFLSDLASGTASGRWYYQCFAGLNALPLSSALRTALCEEIATATEALGLLTTAELHKVVVGLTAQDARQVLERLASEGPAGDEFRCREAVLRATKKNAASLGKFGNEWQRALYLFTAAIHDAETLSSSSLKDAALAIARDGDRSLNAAPGSDSQVLAHSRDTVFGGMFLILPLLDELPLLDATRDWPHADEARAIALVRFLVLLKCLGRENSERAFYDPVLRDLLSIPLTESPETLRMWQARLTPKHLECFSAALFRWQQSRGGIATREQLLVGDTRRDTPAELVLIDAARGLWLRIDRQLTRKPQRIIQSLRASLDMLAEQEGIFYSESSLLPLLRENFPRLNVVDLSDRAMVPAGTETHGADAIIARLDKLQDDLEFLRLPARLKIARLLDRALSIAAQHLLRGFAWRLPGFAGSNLPYLSCNFLEFAASIEEDDSRRVVRIGRPPLHLILNMTGMTRQNYRLSWLDERPFALFQQE